MIIKTDKFFKRRARVYARFGYSDDKIMEIVRREAWWFFGLFPIYVRETVVEKPR